MHRKERLYYRTYHGAHTPGFGTRVGPPVYRRMEMLFGTRVDHMTHPGTQWPLSACVPGPPGWIDTSYSKSLSSMLLQFSTTWEPVKFNAQAILTSLTGATTILIQLSPAGLIPGLMLMQLSPPTMAHSIMLMQITTLDHDQFSCNFQLVPTKFCNAHLMQHYNYHQIRWILTENWMRIDISLLLG